MSDELDRRIINELQGGFPISERPFRDVAQRLDMDEQDLIGRIGLMLEEKLLSRFGPMFNADEMGGAFCLCAMSVPEKRFDEVAEIVNAYKEVAHNYQREHRFNMWFVLATEDPEAIHTVCARIERQTGLDVHPMPKLEEYFIGLRVEV